MRLALLGLLFSGCGFSVTATTDASVGVVDAAPDGLPATCSGSQRACDGRQRLECGADGMWRAEETCGFTCVSGSCVAPSNVTVADVAGCGSGAPRLAPPTGSTLVVTASGGVRINCTPHCGDVGVTTIAATVVTNQTPNLAWFCLSSLDLVTGVTVGLPPTGGPAQAIAFVVDGAASISGAILFDGGNGSATTAGEGAPGAFDGVGRTSGTGAGGGGGACGGNGGSQTGAPNNYGAGGGGGAGGAGTGRNGGNGRSPNNDQTGTGGTGGGACGNPTLTPLVGGAGGGGGGDGSCGGDCGWPSGGGGGVFQLVSRTSIAISGELRARGGNGYGVGTGSGANGGGGGGGAGGGILLEAPVISATGVLSVDGGNGGPSASGPGGAGATGAQAATTGASFGASGQGGSGGGASGGRIRINAATATCPPGASPVASCTTGSLAVP